MSLVVTEKKYKYEVAFSFLKDDEGLAVKINDLMRDRLSTFVYSERQEDLVGKDGIDVFTKVYFEEARIVVVLYREGWGNAGWTRVEMTAIKQRAFNEGYDFTIFISLDQKAPQWLPKTQLWYDFERFGVNGAVDNIEKRVKEYGGQVREESVIDQAVRHAREKERKSFVAKYLASVDYENDFRKEGQELLAIAEKTVAQITEKTGIDYGHTKLLNKFYGFCGDKIGLLFELNQPDWPSMKGASLLVSLVSDNRDRTIFDFEVASTFRKQEYLFYLNEADAKGWIKKNDKSDFKTTEQLISFWQKDLLDAIKKWEEDKERPRHPPIFGKNNPSRNSY